MSGVGALLARLFGFPRRQPAAAQQGVMTTYIGAETEAIFELSPSDHYCNTFACIPWVVFYGYEISVDKLKNALHTIAAKYPVLCARLVPDEDTRLKAEVKTGKGFRFTELKSDLSLVEAILQARVADQSAAFPNFAQLPFFMADFNSFETLGHDAPVFSVKVTHFKDGTCSVAATVHHSIADAQRLAELLADVAAVYRGEEIRELDHDRSKLWPDQLVQKIELGMKPEDFPRKIATKFDTLPLPSFPEETYSIESLFIPKAAIEAAKEKVSARVRDDIKYVSQIDVVSALVWMLRCELEVVRDGKTGPAKTASDLKIPESLFLFFIDLVSNDKTILQENYFGNAFFGTLTQYPKADTEEKKKYDLLNTLVESAMAVRRHVLAMRSAQAHAMSMIAIYKALSDPIQHPPFIGGISSFVKMPFDKMDFGKGTPLYNYGLPSYPFFNIWGCICPTGNDSGMVVNTIIRKRDRENTINSVVLKELVPGTRFVSDMMPSEISKILDLKKSET